MKRLNLNVAFLLLLAGLNALAGEEAVVAWSAKFTVDTTTGRDRVVRGEARLSYSPSYGNEQASAGDYVIIGKVEGLGTIFCKTTEVVRCQADASGTYTLKADDLTGSTCEVLHKIYASDGTVKGSLLVSALTFATVSKPSADIVVDTRPDSVQTLAVLGKSLPLAYSTDWVTNGVPASVELKCIRRRMRDGTLRASATNSLLLAAAPATGTFGYEVNPKRGGSYLLQCLFRDLDGTLLGEPLEAHYEIDDPAFGTMVILR